MEGNFTGKGVAFGIPANRDGDPFSLSSNKWRQHRKWPGNYLAFASIKDGKRYIQLDCKNIRHCGNMTVMILYQLFMESQMSMTCGQIYQLHRLSKFAEITGEIYFSLPRAVPSARSRQGPSCLVSVVDPKSAATRSFWTLSWIQLDSSIQTQIENHKLGTPDGQTHMGSSHAMVPHGSSRFITVHDGSSWFIIVRGGVKTLTSTLN